MKEELTYTEQLFLRYPTWFTGKEVITLTVLELAIRGMIELKPVWILPEDPPMPFIKHHWVKKGSNYSSSSAYPHLDIFLAAISQKNLLDLSDFVYKIHMQIANPADFKNRFVYKPLIRKGYFVNIPFLWNMNMYVRTSQGLRWKHQVKQHKSNGLYEDKLLQMLSNLGIQEEVLNKFQMYDLRSEIDAGFREPLSERITEGIEVDETGFPVASREHWR